MKEDLLGVIWAIVVIQGAITLLSVLEVGVMTALSGPVVIPLGLLTLGGAVLALASARGLRRRKRWARRVTFVAEALVLTMGLVNGGLSLLTEQLLLDLVPLLTTVVAPIAVIVMLVKTKPLFAREEAV